jgi:bifunctional non-homologous end joining protein LigD
MNTSLIIVSMALGFGAGMLCWKCTESWRMAARPGPTEGNALVVDGEAVLLGVDGISDFNGLHSRQHDDEVMLYAFDILAFDGEDVRGLPLSMRKTNLARLLAGRPEGIFVAPFEQGEIGPDLFRKACEFGLEGMVSKRRDSVYRAGRSPEWIKVKNRSHPALDRVRESFA